MQSKNNSRAAARIACLALAASSLAGPAVLAQEQATIHEGEPVRLGNGVARTFVRAAPDGRASAIGISFTEDALEGLPSPAKGAAPNFPYVLPMPQTGPRTVVDHVVVNWESLGHPPAKVYDVPHFDFHFYLVNRTFRQKVKFKSDQESASPRQQPAAGMLPAGYIVPPGTAVSGMGVHAINPASPEFKGQPFTSTFIYGYHNRQQFFLEPMASLSYLKSRPAFSAPVPRPEHYLKAGAYPSSYSVRYDEAARRYEVSLEGLQ